ncbi:MAG: DUF2235 domain-containing protein [Pseudomonadota bacterium]
MKHLAVFLDGTYNEPGSNTNVWRLRSMLAASDDAGNAQLSYYDAGVGTQWYNRIRGGAVGKGVDKNVRDAYEWLIEHYDDGDAIYIFGFSRGAFTARSLAGMIAKCGLLIPGSPMPVLQVYRRYEREDARALFRLPKAARSRDKLPLEDRLMAYYSRQVRIRMIGVWDTVGALKLPLFRSRREKRGEYNKHYVRLSRFFDHAYHAIAIDEHRKSFPLSLWFDFIPEKKPDKAHAPPPVVEQRWFVGAHANVGGGLSNDLLPQIPIKWMQDKAQLAGLSFRHTITLHNGEHLRPISDSFASFLKGVYRIVRLGRRAYRPIGLEREAVNGGWIEPHHETIDATVFDRWRADPEYRPKNLKRWADDNELDPARLEGVQAARHAQR